LTWVFIVFDNIISYLFSTAFYSYKERKRKWGLMSKEKERKQEQNPSSLIIVVGQPARADKKGEGGRIAIL